LTGSVSRKNPSKQHCRTTSHNSPGSTDSFVTKLNADGSALLYSTFLGGSSGEWGYAVAVDKAGQASITGYTSSTDFPTTPGALGTSYNGGGRDAFVTRLNAVGSALVYSTFLGGSSDDVGHGIAVDEAGQTYVTGFTFGGGFPTTPGAFDTSHNGNSDAFVVKLAIGGDSTTYIISGQVKDSSNNPITGVTVSTNTGHSATTNTNGDYAITGLAGGTYTITPSKAGYTFSPTSRTVTVPPSATGQNFTGSGTASGLSISHIEVTQVIQDEQNYVPLIANKPTFVRVYVDCGQGCTALPGVTGTLEVSSSAGSAIIQPYGTFITAEHPPTPPGWISQRSELRKSLNFYDIPLELLTGFVSFTAHVGNTSKTEVLSFSPASRLRVAWIPISYNPPGILVGPYHPDRVIAYRAPSFLQKIFPIAEHDLDYFYQPFHSLTVTSSLTRESAENDYLIPLNRLWDTISRSSHGWRGGAPPDRLFGWAPAEAYVPEDKTGGAANGRVAFALTLGEYQSSWLLAHELGHTLDENGLHHAPCGLPEGEEGDHNIPGGRIDDWGVDFVGVIPRIRAPSPAHYYVAYDFMSYCHPAWVSKYHFRRLVPGFASYDEQSLSTNEESTSPQLVLSVLGTVFTPTLAVDFGTFYPLDSFLPPDENRGTDYCLELRDAEEITLDSRCFDLSFTIPGSGKPMDREAFTMALPYPAETHSVVLTHLGTELERISKSNNAPTVQLLSPNGGEVWSASGTYTVTWTASDADGDPLSFMVSYSDDDGATWMPLALDITDNFLAVESPNIPGSTTARFKVTATDQMLTGEDVSDASFTVSSKGPAAFILLPEREETIPPGLPLYLQGYAYDLEDGTLRDNSLQWSSSIDGDLGNGQTILAMLSPGTHTITLTATDSDDNQGAATLDLYVGYKLYLPVVRR
jgi:hypothetical protein